MKGFCIGVAALALTGSALARPELNAFINKPANTVPELMVQVRSDKTVMDRYMRHFSMDKEEVVNYLGSLKLGTLKKSGNYVIYSVPEGGRIKAHVSFFKKGTPAFVDKNGNPILRVKCGNPFVRGPVVAYAIPPSSPLVSDEVVEPTSLATREAVTTVPEPAMSTLVATVPTVETFDEEIVTPGEPMALRTVPPMTSESVIPPPLAQSFAGGANIGAIAGVLGGIGGVIAVSGGGGGTPNVVPEPATMVALTVGAVALLKRRRRK